MTQGNALISFDGTGVDGNTATLLADPRVAGVMLYRPLNIEGPAQLRRLTRDLVSIAGRPLLIAIDQEGGQLLAAAPGFTPFAGNMALGATGDADLTTRVAAAIGSELRAVGINVDLAPVVDIATRPYNPSMGIRSFGEDPDLVSRLSAAFVAGLQGERVAATLKHFPGKGEAAVDPHHELPVLELDRARLDRMEFAPFRAGIGAGARMMMVGHYGLPAVIGDPTIPTSVSSEVMKGLVRDALGFEGVIVTDALDMGGFGVRSPDETLSAGADLVLYGPGQLGRLPETSPADSPRLASLLDWLGDDGEPSVVAEASHLELASELAARSITLVRDDAGTLPLRPGPDDRILTVMPRPIDLTPADTSSYVDPGLAAAVRMFHQGTSEVVVSQEPPPEEVRRVIAAAREHTVVVLGTIDAGPSQADLVRAILQTGVPTVTVALRTPYDLAGYPQSNTHLASFGILPPTMRAVAGVLFGAGVSGSLPVAIPGLYAVGHGIHRVSAMSQEAPH